MAPKQGTAIALWAPWLCLTYGSMGGRDARIVRTVRLVVKAIVVEVVAVVEVLAIGIVVPKKGTTLASRGAWLSLA